MHGSKTIDMSKDRILFGANDMVYIKITDDLRLIILPGIYLIESNFHRGQ